MLIFFFLCVSHFNDFSIFTSVKLQSYPQSTRFLVYTLIDALLLRSRPALKRLGKEFIAAYCNMAEGEKDPRNLMISFSIVKVVLLEFDISAHIEVSKCYFEIRKTVANRTLFLIFFRIYSTSLSVTSPLHLLHRQMIHTV